MESVIWYDKKAKNRHLFHHKMKAGVVLRVLPSGCTVSCTYLPIFVPEELKFYEINYVFAIVCIWISFVSVLVLLLKFIRIGLLTNRLGRNKIPYHSGNYSYHSCPSATRVRIISLVVRNFIPTRAIGQESYNTQVLLWVYMNALHSRW